MTIKKAPTERGFRPVMLSEKAYLALVSYKAEKGLSSASAAVLRSLSDSESQAQPVDWEAMFMACRVDPKTAQRIREYNTPS
jgi:hypothetical protein